MIWTAKHDDALRSMMGTHSFAGIGAAIGVSRSAAMSRARRLGLIKLTVTPIRVPKVTIMPVSSAAVEPRHLTFDRLGPFDCRYPYGEPGDYTFCGHPKIDGKSYCSAHFTLCWREPAKRVAA